MNKLCAFGLIAFFMSTSDASASYLMFCKLHGEIVSDPVRGAEVTFDFRVASASDIEDEVLGRGEPDCHLLQGRLLTVHLEQENVGDLTEIVRGSRIVLERYEIDAVDNESGAVLRSIKHVRKDI